MLATKLSISLDPYSLTLLNRVQQDYDCSNRSQAVARVLKLYQDIVDRNALENAYAASSASGIAINAEFDCAQLDGLVHEAW
jgi:metal-responsive CopG/Arc/MetJ family transcriptional regulator